MRKFKAVWRSMISRCGSEDAFSWSQYGGKGVRVSKNWLVYKNFERDMLPRYHRYFSTMGDITKRNNECTLDRIDPNKNYSKSNCRWADMITQHHNKRGRKSSIVRDPNKQRGYTR